MQCTSVPCVGPARLEELSLDMFALIASGLPGEMISTGLLSASKSLLELEQTRATAAALSFKGFVGAPSNLDSVKTGDCFVVPAASAKFVGCLNRRTKQW